MIVAVSEQQVALSDLSTSVTAASEMKKKNFRGLVKDKFSCWISTDMLMKKNQSETI